MLRYLMILPLLASCTTTDVVAVARCELDLDVPVPDAAAVGESVVVTGHPFTTSYDTALFVGDTRATIDDLSKSDACDDCDDCREDNSCTVCGDCDACDQICTTDCEQTITFAVPEGAGTGVQPITVMNAHGTSQPTAFSVLGGDDTGSSDSGTADTGSADSGSADSGNADSGSTDTGSSDSGSTDTGSSDSGSADTGGGPPQQD